jgi:hypothetical protein
MNLDRTWYIHLPSWAMDDGAYPEFIQGQSAEFSLEFHALPNLTTESKEPIGSRPAETQGQYHVTADCVVSDERVTVLDFGLRVWRHEGLGTSEAPFRTGRRYRTTLNLFVDCFGMNSWQNDEGDEIPLVYSWRIEAILHPTEAACTDRQRGCILQCELLPVSPKIGNIPS